MEVNSKVVLSWAYKLKKYYPEYKGFFWELKKDKNTLEELIDICREYKVQDEADFYDLVKMLRRSL